MQSLRQLGIGIVIAIISVLLVVGGIMLSLAESQPPPSTPTPIPPTLPLEFPTPTATASPVSSETPTETPVDTSTAPPTDTLLVHTATPCTPPVGWINVITRAGDTIYSVAERYKTSAESLTDANCLLSPDLPAGLSLYVPPVPTVTVIACGPPSNWVRTHIVQRGDTLFRIALSYGITYPQLQRANCMGSSTIIYAGQRLWVPNVPTRTPVPGITLAPDTSTPTNTSSATATTEAPTFTPTFTPSPTATLMPSVTPEATHTQSE